MEAMLIPPYRSPFQPPRIHRRITMQNIPRRSQFILSVLSTDKNTNVTTTQSDQPQQTIYNDNWFDRVAINHLSKSLQASTGLRSTKSGYDGLVEAATLASRRFSAAEQRKLVSQTLVTAFPRPIMSLIKTVMPPSKFAREYFAAFTTIFFPWLVGPCEVRESEFGGRIEKNVVHIPKCRLLEETNCVGMCTNLCKMPSQAFIKESLGMSINMIPNFEDMSCEMIFGQEPPPQETDPAFAQPCYKQCKAKFKHQTLCTGE